MKMKTQEAHDAMLPRDIHKHYCVIVAVDREGRVVLHSVRVEHIELEGRLKKKLQASDHVVFELTTNARYVYDLLELMVEQVVVANPIKVKQIVSARVKTDVRDTLILSRLLAANLVPDVCVSPAYCVRCASCCLTADNW